jgi:hypothetical protein
VFALVSTVYLHGASGACWNMVDISRDYYNSQAYCCFYQDFLLLLNALSHMTHAVLLLDDATAAIV